MKNLIGKKAFVTAAAQGIGLATVMAFAKRGATVIAADINTEKLSELQGIDGVTLHSLDMLDRTEIHKTANKFGAIDVLVNCVGYVHHGTILDCSEADWAHAWDLNVTSMYRLIRAFLPSMLQNGGGSIINVASVVSNIKAAPDRLAYGTTKAAVIGLTKSVARDFIKDGIRCNAICPGTVHTPSWEGRVNNAENPEKARKDFIARQPMGRLGTAEEIAGAALYLASEEAAYLTGTSLIIDGGMSL